jgi:hypothetical protein
MQFKQHTHRKVNNGNGTKFEKKMIGTNAKEIEGTGFL